jgi:K+-sensing histidine kinase KdpD
MSESLREQVRATLQFFTDLNTAVHGADTFSSALIGCLETVCRRQGWCLGQCWLLNADGSALKCCPVVHFGAESFPDFRHVSLQTTFPKGIGPPGRVWETLAPGFVADISQELNFGRQGAAVQSGFKSACALPLLIDSTLCIFECFSTEPVSPDDLNLQAVAGHASVLLSHKQSHLEHARLLAQKQTDAIAAQIAQRRWEFLADSAARLMSSLDLDETLSTLAQLLVPGLADWVCVDMIDEEDPSVCRVAIKHASESKGSAAAEYQRRYSRNPDRPFNTAEIVSSGRSKLYSEIPESILSALAEDAEHLRLIHELGLASAMLVPLTARGRTLGVMTLVASESGRRYDAEDLQTAESLAARAAVALDHAHLYKTAEQGLRARDEFHRIACHQLKDSLTAIMLQIDWMLRKGGLSRSRLEGLKYQSEQMAHLLNNIQEAPEAPRCIDLEELDLAELVRSVAEHYRDELAQKGYALSLRADAPAFGRWDRRRMEQAVKNLLAPARKFGGGKRLDMSVESDPRSVHVALQTEGPGLPPERIRCIFCPFERAMAPQEFGEPELDLYVARQIFSAHGGSIQITNRPDAAGLSLLVELRRNAAAEQ